MPAQQEGVVSAQPSWLTLIPHDQQAALLRLMESAPRSAEEHVNKMLAAPPWPPNKPDAQARVSAVICYLVGGYRVGDRHPSTESAEAG